MKKSNDKEIKYEGALRVCNFLVVDYKSQAKEIRDVSNMLLSMLRSLQLLIAENVQYISVGSELFTKKLPSYTLKLFSL